jgi:8-oxo-dGTP diphosphatase
MEAPLRFPERVRSYDQICAEVEAEKRKPEARSYDLGRFFCPSLTVDVVIFTVQARDLRVLLVSRGGWPFLGRWALPGGFVKENEGLDEAARRELFEETGVRDVYLEQLHTFGHPGRDPRTRVVTVAYYALVAAENLAPVPGSDASSTDWWSVYQLPDLAFDHDLILLRALVRLRERIWDSAVASQLMPEKFTLTDLQSTYEVILDRSLDKRNFRKKILSREVIEDTGETWMEGRHRPARLYRFRSESCHT